MSVAADPWLSTGGARAVLGRVKAFCLARHSGQDSGCVFGLAALRTVSRSLTAVLYGTESMAGYI